MTDVSKATRAAERKLVLAALAIHQQMPPGHIQQSRELRVSNRGAGGTWFFSHARVVNFVDAVNEYRAALALAGGDAP